MNLVIRLVLFHLLIEEGIESNPGPQTGSTRGNIVLQEAERQPERSSLQWLWNWL